MTPQEKLAAAAKLVEEAVGALNLRTSTCACCSRVVYENWTAKMANDALGTLPVKLRRLAADHKAFAQ